MQWKMQNYMKIAQMPKNFYNKIQQKRFCESKDKLNKNTK